jgi:hypothetical protein
MTKRVDLTDVVEALLAKLGRAERLDVATLGYAPRNLKAMLKWLDSGVVGSLVLLASRFFFSHNQRLWEETLAEFRKRRQQAAFAPSHCKVIALAFASGERLTIEGSANLCGNGSAREQFALINSPGLYDFHSLWIAEMVAKHEGDEGTS